MTSAWLPQFACPECHGPACADEDGPSCARCGHRFARVGDLFHFLTPARVEAAAPFLRQYRTVRQREAYRLNAPEYYRMLPCVLPSDPHAAEWRLRRESYGHLQRRALPAVWGGPIRVLDLGAGSGWLSHRLAASGHRVVAVDRLADEADGLGACRHYPVPFAAVQADFDALPFAPEQFELVVFGGSLHYSPDPAATIAEAKRMLLPGGVVAVMDSPMFVREADGRAMLDQQLRHMAEEYALTHVVRPGVGFLTFSGLEEAARAVGLRGSFCRSTGPIGWRVRRQLAYLRLRRAPAAFGVWVAR